MATPEQVSPWIRQAEADLAAARVESDGIAECHRRYWIQQSYEKAIKALAFTLLGGTDDENKALRQLLSHSPLKLLAERIVDPKTPLPKTLDRKRLRLLKRDLDAFVRRLDNAKFLEKVDDLEPTPHDEDPSYRYPFMAGGEYLPPIDFQDWELHLGGIAGAISAVQRLIRAVKDDYKKTSARTPK